MYTAWVIFDNYYSDSKLSYIVNVTIIAQFL